MYISEVNAGTDMKLEVSVGTKTMEFQVKSTEVSDKRQLKMIEEAAQGNPYLVTEPVMKDGKMVGFSTKGVSYKVQYVETESKKVFEWKEVVVKQIAFSTGDRYHILICAKERKEINRRESFRLWLGCNAVAMIGLNRVAINVVIKDISATGVSFYMINNLNEEEKLKPRVSTSVVLSFQDEETGKSFKLNAVIVRVEEVNEMKTLFGCKFAKESEVLARFINKKQMQRSNVNKNAELEQ